MGVKKFGIGCLEFAASGWEVASIREEIKVHRQDKRR